MAEVIDDNPDATIAEITQLITNKVLSAQYFVGGFNCTVMVLRFVKVLFTIVNFNHCE